MNGRTKTPRTMNKILSILALSAMILFAPCCGDKEIVVVIPEVFPEDETPEGDTPSQARDPYRVKCKPKVSTTSWDTYNAYTVECIQGFNPSVSDPATDQYGGWTDVTVGNPDGFFSVRKIGNRWWLVDPDGYLFLSKGVAVFSPGSSDRQRANVTERFGSASGWARQELPFIKELGFNSLGAWSQVDVVRSLADVVPYTVILSPMGSYIGELRNSSDPVLAAAFKGSKSFEKYPYDFAMVFDERFDQVVDNTIARASTYRNDKFLIGYFIDNEIPWKEYALENCLTKWPASHINRQKAQTWLDQRKGRSGCTIADATSDDKKAFVAYCYEIYLQKVSAALKKYDPNHLFLGDRFNQWSHELVNPHMFEVAGKYVDVISVNHYQRWEPDVNVLRNWESWSGKPCIITEFYTKGLDTVAAGLANTTGAGWVVETQADRGLFYQNFVNRLIQSRVCVGWHWFTYMDNDPTGNADDSNVDSNKGLVQWNTDRYPDLYTTMTPINRCTYNLAKFYAN